MTELTTTRANPMIDPLMHVWGWEIPVYLFLGGLAAGGMVLSALLLMLDSVDEAEDVEEVRELVVLGRRSAQAMRAVLDELARLNHGLLGLADLMERGEF